MGLSAPVSKEKYYVYRIIKYPEEAEVKMKRRISIVVVLAMLISNLLSVVSFAEFSDVAADNSYRTSILTLSNLGIINGYDDGTFKPEGPITRAEFTKMIVTALGRGDMKTEPKEFSDVSEHWARFNIKTAYDMGIINGFEDATFRPDQQVTYEQALKMVVCTLGYTDFAEQKGGYPTGYTSQAETLGLTKGVKNQKYSEPALRQVISQVVYNALEIETREKDVKGIWQLTGETILSKNLGIHKLEGVLVGVEDVKTNDCNVQLLSYQMSVKGPLGEVVIDTRNYKDMTINALQNYIGNEVTVYYSEAKVGGDKYLVVFDTETVKNTSYEIAYEDIVSYDGSTLRYYEPNGVRDKSMSVNAANVTVIYNGQTLADNESYTMTSKADASVTQSVYGKVNVLKELLAPSSSYFVYGDVVLTDSGSDGNIDMVTVNDYRWMIAHKAVSSTDYTIQNTLLPTDTLVVDPDDIDKKIYVEKNGKEVAPTQISKNDVVTYSESFDGNVIKVYVTKETVKGKVNSLSADKITIEGKEYNLDANCVKFIQSKTSKTLAIGNDVTMYLDKMGTVVYGEVSEEAAAPYAYITDQFVELSEDALYITAYIPSISSSTAKNYKVAEKVKVNGTVCNSYSDVQTKLSESKRLQPSPDSSPSNDTYSQVARIKVSGGEITEIVTLDGNATGANSDPSKIVKAENLQKYSYSSNSFKLNGTTKFSINSSTVIIDVPSDRSQKGNYAKRSSGYFSNGGEYTVEAYDVNDNKYAGLLIRYTTGNNSINTKYVDSSHSVVGAVLSEGYDSKENAAITQVPLYSSSTSLKTWNVHPTATSAFNALQVGDVIQFDYDNDNRVQGLAYVIKYADIQSVLSGTTYDWTATQTQDSSNRWQKYTFDFKYPESISAATDNYYKTYQHPSLGTIPHSRATMYNVLRIVTDENEIHVTQSGFNSDGTMGDVGYEDVAITSSTKILRAVEDQTGKLTSFSTFEEDGTTPLSIESFKDAQSYGTSCSKIMVSTNKGEVKLIVIYE